MKIKVVLSKRYAVVSVIRFCFEVQFDLIPVLIIDSRLSFTQLLLPMLCGVHMEQFIKKMTGTNNSIHHVQEEEAQVTY